LRFEGPDWRARQGHLAEVMARTAAENIARQERGEAATASFREEINLLCIMDTGKEGVFVYRDENRETAPRGAWARWAKLALFEENQMFNQLIRPLLFGIVLWSCLWLGLGHNPSMAATLTSVTSGLEKSVQPHEISNLEAGVDRFLTSIPSGYYTIGNVAGLKDQLKDPQTILVDVREPSEYRAGHIPDAINIPLRSLTHNLDNIPRDRPVVLYCSTGYRSAMGVMTLHLLGYDNVRGFPPSFAGWKTVGEAIIK